MRGRELKMRPVAVNVVSQLHQPEIEDLDEVEVASIPAHVDIGRLDVPVNQAMLVCLRERMTDLAY